MAADRALIYEFVSEAKEHLANVADDLLALEQGKDDSSRYRVDRLFRAVHSVKGGAGFFGRRAIEQLAHAMETVLDPLRQRDGSLGASVVDALLAGADRIQALLDDVEHSADVDVSGPLSRLRPFFPADGDAPTPPPPGLALTVAEPPPAAVLATRPAGHAWLFRGRVDLGDCNRRHGLGPLAVVRRFEAAGAVLDAGLEVADAGLDRPLPSGGVFYWALVAAPCPLDEFLARLGIPGAEVEAVESPPESAPPPPAAAEAEIRPPERVGTLRIPVGLVDELMTLAGELVLVRNQALRAIPARDAALRPILQRLDAVTGGLQDAVLRTRMQPVGNLFGKFPRMVRDLSRQLGKEIELEVSGTEVELDKTILEALSDPLTHLIRNSCDHGIEPPGTRSACGKPDAGRVSLRARHLGDQILLEVRDDGKGIDPEAVRRKALQQGLRPPAELARAGPRELFSMILLPGFSTAAAVTDLSGRGVGMDVVKTNVDRLGGVLEIDSEPGAGTAFTLRLPLTLAIIPCLLVTAGGERYALPQKDLEELVCVRPGDSRVRVEYTFDQEVVRLRDRLLPLVRLGEVLERPTPFDAAARADILKKHRKSTFSGKSEPLFFAVVKCGSQRFGLVVDQILNSEEIVVKPVHEALRGLACFAGATILGDGRVALILGIEGVARHAGARYDVAPPAEIDGAGAAAEAHSVLLFRYGPQEQFAVPLGVVRRIESVRADALERVGGQEFLTVDGVPTRVLRPDQFLSVSPCPPRETMYLLLPKNARRPVGVLFAEVVDAETVSGDFHPDAYRADGLIGSAVVRGRLTLFLDLYRLADLADPPADAALPAPAGRRGRVLLVEDTQFFRQVVKGYLEADGFAVVTAADGAEGLARLDEGAFDLVVSDIEMPVLDGWGFARALRLRPGGGRVPLLALTTLSSDADKERALACGFDRHEMKLDRERFLAAVAELLGARAP